MVNMGWLLENYDGSPPELTCSATNRVRIRSANISGMSTRMVQCVKLKQELPGLETPPWPGDLGQRIYDTVSAQGWKLWEERQKMVLNEYRLLPWQKEAQELIARHMEEFFFNESAAAPPGYVPEPHKH